jgi:hypothetical protein
VPGQGHSRPGAVGLDVPDPDGLVVSSGHNAPAVKLNENKSSFNAGAKSYDFYPTTILTQSGQIKFGQFKF